MEVAFHSGIQMRGWRPPRIIETGFTWWPWLCEFGKELFAWAWRHPRRASTSVPGRCGKEKGHSHNFRWPLQEENYLKFIEKPPKHPATPPPPAGSGAGGPVGARVVRRYLF